MKQGTCAAEKGGVAVLPGSPNTLISNDISPEISSETRRIASMRYAQDFQLFHRGHALSEIRRAA